MTGRMWLNHCRVVLMPILKQILKYSRAQLAAQDGLHGPWFFAGLLLHRCKVTHYRCLMIGRRRHCKPFCKRPTQRDNNARFCYNVAWITARLTSAVAYQAMLRQSVAPISCISDIDASILSLVLRSRCRHHLIACLLLNHQIGNVSRL
jgi:hypothetical protein